MPLGALRERTSPVTWRPGGGGGGDDDDQHELSDSIEWGKMAMGAYSGSSIVSVSSSASHFGSAPASQWSSVSHSQEFHEAARRVSSASASVR